jgi:hypothetical protein
MSDELLAAVKQAAALETAPAHLAARVLDSVAYRQRLEAPLAAARRARVLQRVAACGVLAGLAAGAWLWARAPLPLPRIAAERSTPASASAVGSAAPRATEPFQDPCRVHVASAGQAPLIDDFEDGDDALAPLEQRAGFWRWARESDAPGTAPALIPVPRPAATARNKLALHVKGGQLYDWGATVEVSFRPPCYDATSYDGLKLQARGPGRLYIALREVGDIPPFEGGSCEHDCYNAHVAKVDLSRDWHSYQVRWAELHQRGLGKPPLDPSRLHSVAFLIRAEDTPYDIWIDDVRFLPKGS